MEAWGRIINFLQLNQIYNLKKAIDKYGRRAGDSALK